MARFFFVDRLFLGLVVFRLFSFSNEFRFDYDLPRGPGGGGNCWFDRVPSVCVFFCIFGPGGGDIFRPDRVPNVCVCVFFFYQIGCTCLFD